MLVELGPGQITAALQKLQRDLAAGQAVLDFRTVQRLDVDDMRALEDLGNRAAEIKACLVLRGVNVDLYKAIKLMKTTARFSYEGRECA